MRRELGKTETNDREQLNLSTCHLADHLTDNLVACSVGKNLATVAQIG